MKYEVIPFQEFMLGVSWMPPALPLTEGLIGFGTLGTVLIFLAIAEKKGWFAVNENVIKGGLMLAFVYGVLKLAFSAVKFMYI